MSANATKGDDVLAIWGRRAPVLIVVYILALLILRLSFSPFLEVDEAQFVGNVDLRLVYANSHPPLYNWLLRLILELTGWNWSLSTGLLKYALLGLFHFLTWDAARRLGGDRAGLLALAASAFLPQIVWMSTHTLAHSIMVMTGVVALVHAAVLLVEKPSRAAYAWLGAAAALGALAKYNFLLFAVPFVGAVLASQRLRSIVYRRDALIAVGVFAALTAPVAIAAAMDAATSLDRISKLYRADEDLVWYDVPGVGIDGFLSFLTASIAWAGPALLVWTAATWWESRRGELPAPADHALLRALGRTMVASLVIFGLIVLAADMHRVHERYLTPLLATLPIWLAAARPTGRLSGWICAVAGVAYVAALIGFWGMASYGKHRYGYDYEAIAAQVRRVSQQPLPLISPRHDDRANMVLALGWPGASSPQTQPVESRAILFWRGRSKPPMRSAPEGFQPMGEVYTVSTPFRNRREGSTVYRFQLIGRPSG